MDTSSDNRESISDPPLARALNQSENVKKVENCAHDLSSVNLILKEELVEYSPVGEIRKALVQSEHVEDKVQECADELHVVNASLAEEVVERENLEKQLSDSEALEKRLYPDLPTNKTRRFPSLIVFSSALTAYANRKECAQGYRGLRS